MSGVEMGVVKSVLAGEGSSEREVMPLGAAVVT